jgi:hypothetical protein
MLRVLNITTEHLGVSCLYETTQASDCNLAQDTRLRYLSAARQARCDSALIEVRRCKCTAGTRESILGTLWDWKKNPDSPKIYWMNGMAGTGGTTIAYTLGEKLSAAHQLGASFFCSRLLPDCRDAIRIVPNRLERLWPHRSYLGFTERGGGSRAARGAHQLGQLRSIFARRHSHYLWL